jgi:hypothetical protein
MYFRSAVIVVILLIDVKPGSPQSGAGTVSGQVKDSSGAVLGQAAVTLTNDTGGAQTTHTQDDGTYVFRGVAPGAYTVSAAYKGLTQNDLVAVMVNGSETEHGEIVMKPSEVTQQITVEENSNQLSVDPSQNADALVIKGAALDALPDDPDDLQQDLQALAGPSAGPNGGENFVDGSRVRHARLRPNRDIY